MRILIWVKTAVASLVLATVAAAWALPPQLVSSGTTSGPYNGGASRALGVATTVPPPGGRAAYVVTAQANSSNDMVVTAWQNTTPELSDVGFDTVQGPGVYGIAITGLDSSRVVTADIDFTGNLLINTWSVSSAGVVPQNGSSTGAGVAYQNVAITTLTSTQVVTAYQLLDGTLAVEAWTIGADGYPTPALPIATGDPADQVSIATVNANQVVTAINDETDQAGVLQVATWGVDSTGVQPQGHVRTTYPVNAQGESVGVGAGNMFLFRDSFPFFQYFQAAVTPILNGSNVEVVNWAISESGALTQTNTPIPTATYNDVAVAGSMLPENAAITAYGNNDGFATIGGLPPWSVVPNIDGNGINSIATTTAGTANYNSLGLFDAYLVTAVLAYTDDLNTPTADPTAVLKIREYSYRLRGPFGY